MPAAAQVPTSADDPLDPKPVDPKPVDPKTVDPKPRAHRQHHAKDDKPGKKVRFLVL